MNIRQKIWTLSLLIALVPFAAIGQPPEELPAEEGQQEEGFEAVAPSPVAQPLVAPAALSPCSSS